MKSPVAELRSEHEAILSMLQILECICKESERAGKVASQEFGDIIEFLEVFIGACHHGKEEDLLFPALQIARSEKEDGPIAMLIEEHVQGRSRVKEMKDGFDAYQRSGKKDKLEKILTAARKYILLLTAHIEKENTKVFPKAEKILSVRQQDELLKGFDEIEMKKIGPGRHEAYHGMLDRLKKQYLN